MNRVAILLMIIFGCQMAKAQCTSNRYTDTIFHSVTTTSGIYFATANTNLGIAQDLYLDFYEPTGDTLQNRPLIIYAFGGGFLIGTRNQPPIPDWASYFAKCGYAVASIDYRIGFNVLSGQSAERAVYRGIQDLRAAIRFLCQRYSQYKIDTLAIFLTGSSAGCFSGLHTIFMEQGDVPAAAHGILLEPSDLGCLDCSGNSDNNLHVPQIRGMVNHWGALLDTSLIRSTTKDNVPVISFQGDNDLIVPYNTGPPFSLPIFPTVYGSLPIHVRMDHLGIRNELHSFVGFGHEPWLLTPSLKDTCYKFTRPFLYSILKPLPLTIVGDTILCVNATTTYSVAYRAGSKYCWSVTGGNVVSINANQVTVQWTQTGVQTLTVRELNRNDVNGDLYSLNVAVAGYPVALFTDSIALTHVFFRDSSLGAITWEYTFGDGASDTLPNTDHIYATATTYQVGLVVSNGYCTDTVYKSVTTHTCPAINFQSTVAIDTVRFTADSVNGSQIQWIFGDGSTDTTANPTHVYSTAGTHQVGLVANNGYCIDTVYESVTTHTCPVANYQFIVANDTVSFAADSVAGLQIQWLFGDGTTDTTPNPTHAYHQSSTFNVALVASNGFCTDTIIKTVTTVTCPTANIHFVSVGDTVYFIADSSNGAQYQWNFGDGTTATGVQVGHAFTATQTYTVTLSVTNATNCLDSQTVDVPFTYVAHSTGIAANGVDELKVYPNPTNDRLFICLPTLNNSDFELTIFNAIGERAEAKLNRQGDKLELDLSDCSNGLYLIRMHQGNRIWVSRVSKL